VKSKHLFKVGKKNQKNNRLSFAGWGTEVLMGAVVLHICDVLYRSVLSPLFSV